MTRKEIQKLLENLNSQLKAEIEASLLNLKEARSVGTKLTNLVNRANELVATLQDSDTGVDAKLNGASQKTQLIADTVATAQANAEAINQHLQEAQGKITQMQAAFADFTNVKAQIDDPDTGLQAVVNAARAYKGQVQASAADSQALQAKIQQSVTSVQADLEALQAAFADFTNVKAQIDDPDTGLQALQDESNSLKDGIAAVSKESETLYKEIVRFKDSAAKNVSSIEAIKETSEKALENIKKQEAESESIKEKVSKIFQLVSQTGHANYFDQRRKQLIRASWAWLILSTIVILFAIKLGLDHVAPLVKLQNQSTDIAIEALIIRASLITPLFAFGIFGVTNYSKERRLAEQYAFKAVSASTIESSIVLLDRSLDKVPVELKHDKITDFAIEAVRCIHQEPQELVKATKVKLNAGNKLLQVGGELSENMETLNKNIESLVDKPDK